MGTKYEGNEVERRALDLYIKLMRAADSVTARVNSHLLSANLTMSQFGTLETLYHLGPMGRARLEDKILRSSGNMTLVIDNLATRGLIIRQRDPEDSRQIVLHITDAGRKVIDTLFPRHVKNIVAEMSILSDEEQGVLAELCRRVGTQTVPSA